MRLFRWLFGKNKHRQLQATQPTSYGYSGGIAEAIAAMNDPMLSSPDFHLNKETTAESTAGYAPGDYSGDAGGWGESSGDGGGGDGGGGDSGGGS